VRVRRSSRSRSCFASARLASWGTLLCGLWLATGAPGEERRTVAILPVVVHAVDQQAYLREGLADMLASRLGQRPGIGVIRVDDPAQATIEPDAARAAARAVGAQWVLFGSFTRFGEGASLDMLCLPVAAIGDPGPRSIFVQSAEIADLIPRLDSLTERVALHVLGQDAALAPGVTSGASPELDELRRRVEALERRAAASAAPAQAPRPEAQP
jgi:outer membrane protein insertion porin family